MGADRPRPPPAAVEDPATGLPVVLLEAGLVCKGWCRGLLDAMVNEKMCMVPFFRCCCLLMLYVR